MLNLYNYKNYLSQSWHTSKEIREHLSSCGLNIRDEELRKEINNFNDQYDESDLFIAHSNKGFLLTCDKHLIELSVIDIKKRAIAMFERARKIEKAKSLKSNIKLDIPKELEQEKKVDSYAIVSRMVNINGKLVEIKEAVYG